MDAPEVEQDVVLQRKASDFIADLDKSLNHFLWKTTTSGRTSIRRRVRVRETERLVNLLNPFQENPQLLDPHLDKFVSTLADALLAYLRSPPSQEPNTNTQLLYPLSKAICKLLYTFCKVRGEKVIVRFFSTETRHLELLLSAIERGSTIETPSPQEDGQSANPTADTWEWEERYIVLLWLSQLLLAPFDLASISSQDTDALVQPSIPGLSWPPNTPGLTARVVPLALQYLSSSGKERDAAKILLGRIAMRKDMQQLGMLNALVEWAIYSLQLSSEPARSTYYYIGVLSFLAGILVSSEGTTDMDPYLERILRVTQHISSSDEPFFTAIKSNAVARKTMLKILRTITVLLIHNPESMPDSDMAIEATIDHMLDSLADSATPVRFAASKALSIITLKLPDEMAVEVGTAVLESLKENILYIQKKAKTERDLSRVNPLAWHGIILTMSHLLYRRSIAAAELPPILNALRLGLTFEQRSTSGSSTGTNVRDAACFGIWALARRYPTTDLQALELKEDVFPKGSTALLQTLATELVVSASLDPAGNIRRGSSAALQELIGRHPNTIEEGIKVVQVVDYHAVALRSRAVLEVGLQAAQLSDQYYQGLLAALLGWRGIQDGDASARRVAADAIGKLVWAKISTSRSGSYKELALAIDLVGERLRSLSNREVEERHGLILALAAIMERIPSAKENAALADIVRSVILQVLWILKNVNTNWSSGRNLSLMADSVSRMLIAVYPILNATLDRDTIREGVEMVEKILSINDVDSVDVSSVAAAGILDLVDNAQRVILVSTWNNRAGMTVKGGRTNQGKSYIHTLFNLFPQREDSIQQAEIISTFRKRWTEFHEIDIRVTILNCLANSSALQTHTESFIDMISDGLDDFTINAQGDVGSRVRIEAAGAAGMIWKDSQPVSLTKIKLDAFKRLFGKVLRVAAEKLDRVRAEGQKAVAYALSESDRSTFSNLSTSSSAYFRFLLDLQSGAWLPPGVFQNEWQLEFLEGYITSADTGAEDLARASREALAQFCVAGNTELVFANLSRTLSNNISKSSSGLPNDRIIVPCLEAISYLFDARILQTISPNWQALFVLVQKAHLKSRNVRKLEASIKVYGGLAEMYPPALDKLLNMIIHPFPKIRNLVAEELFVCKGVGKGVDWGIAKKVDMESLREEMKGIRVAS